MEGIMLTSEEAIQLLTARGIIFLLVLENDLGTYSCSNILNYVGPIQQNKYSA